MALEGKAQIIVQLRLCAIAIDVKRG